MAKDLAILKHPNILTGSSNILHCLFRMAASSGHALEFVLWADDK